MMMANDPDLDAVLKEIAERQREAERMNYRRGPTPLADAAAAAVGRVMEQSKSGIDFAPINQIHRGHDGFISFASIDEWGEFTEPFAVSAKQLQRYRYLPQLAPMLAVDSFYTICGQQFPAYKEGRIQRSQFAVTPRGGKLPMGRHSKANTQYLTACWTDIDCYKLDMEPGTVIGQVINAEKDGRIPRVSIVVESGGGIWLLWLVRDDRNPGKPPRAYKSLVNLWAVIQRTIHQRFGKYGADPQSATDCSRYTRTPGSINSKWKTEVEYWVHFDQAGKVWTYTLPELAKWFNVPPPKLPPEKPRLTKSVDGKDPAKQAAGAKGYIRRWEQDLDDLYLLWNRRGRFGPGHRNYAVLILTKCLKGVRRYTVAETWEIAGQLFDSFDQPANQKYTRKQFSATVASVLNGPLGRERSPRRADIAESLDVTPEEAAVLSYWPAASRFGHDHPPEDAKLTKSEARAVRQEAERKIVAELGGAVPTIPEMIRRLQADYGLEVSSTETIHRDYKKLGLDKQNPRSHKRKPDKPIDNLRLF